MYQKIFIEKIRAAREKSDFKQKEVQELTGITQSQLSKIESGKQQPTIEQLGKLIDLYEVSADWILGTGIKKTDRQ